MLKITATISKTKIVMMEIVIIRFVAILRAEPDQSVHKAMVVFWETKEYSTYEPCPVGS